MKYLKAFWMVIWNWLTADDLVDDEIKFDDSEPTFEYTLSEEKYDQYAIDVATLLGGNEGFLDAAARNDYWKYRPMLHSYVFNCFLTDVPHDVCAANLINKFSVIKSVKQKVRRGIPRC